MDEETKRRAVRVGKDMMRREFEALARARAILRAYEQEANDETPKGSLDELRREVLERVRDVLLGEEGS